MFNASENILRDLQLVDSDEFWFFSAISLTFLFYYLGALYLVAPIVGWLLLARLLMRSFISEPKAKSKFSFFVYLWIFSAIGLLIALVIGHVSFDLGLGKVIKSTIGWAKGWALLVVFILIGLLSSVRYECIVRAACVVGLCALIIAPLLIFAWLIGLPGYLYVSPLKIFGGSGPEFFTVILYEIDPSNGSPRWRFFAPWAPAVGFVANIYLLCACFEKDRFWQIVGILGNAIMVLLAASRMGILVMFFVPLTVFLLSRLTRPHCLLLGAIFVALFVLNFEFLYEWLNGVLVQIKEARADSTRVRATLNEIGLYYWRTEAFWFGHGVVGSSSHLVEFMPIGTHHNWYGLLFVKGIVGFLCFLIPFTLTGATLLIRSQVEPVSRLALGAFLVLSFFSLSENIEALAYLTWPAWLLIGIALRIPLRELSWSPLFRQRTSFQS